MGLSAMSFFNREPDRLVSAVSKLEKKAEINKQANKRVTESKPESIWVLFSLA